MRLKRTLYSILCTATFSANAYYSYQGKVYDEANQPYLINGVSWSGIQDTNVLQGLQSNPLLAMPNHPYNPVQAGMLDKLTDPKNPTQFKTIRLPIQPGVLYDDTNQVDLNKSLSAKAYPNEGNGIFCKSWQTNGTACSSAVSPKVAFWRTLRAFKNKNLKVVIDFHHRYGYGDNYRDGTVYNINQYQKDLKLLVTELKQRQLDNVIGIDIFNEPYRLNWFKPNGNQVPWTKVIAAAANVISVHNPQLLLFVEGPNGGNNDADNPVICIDAAKIVDDPNGYSHSPDPQQCGNLHRVFFKGNWGEDFKPLLNQNQAKQGNAVFAFNKLKQQLLNQGITNNALNWLLGKQKQSKSHIVFSPHVYPAEVATWETAPGKPSDLRFDWTWGFLHKAGYPIVLGEASWKTNQGKAFFTKAVMPYLKKSNIGTNQVFFWAIGYLGDTVSAIDPNSGVLNEDVQTTLAPYFGKATPHGKVAIKFLQNMPFDGNVKVKIKQKQYDCNLVNGCTINLPQGNYAVSVANQYRYLDSEKSLYRLYTDKLAYIRIIANQTKVISLPIQSVVESRVLPQTIVAKVNFINQNNQLIQPQLKSPLHLKAKAISNPALSAQCRINNSQCQISLYNTNINNRGKFGDQVYQLNIAGEVVDKQGHKYLLKQAPKNITISGNKSVFIPMTLEYQQQATNPPSSNTECQASLAVNNYWGSGAVIQGKLTNTGRKAIKNYELIVQFASSPGLVSNAWIGINSNYQLSGKRIKFKASAYDNYNGLMPNQSQSIGFQIGGQYSQKPVITKVSCQ